MFGYPVTCLGDWMKLGIWAWQLVGREKSAAQAVETGDRRSAAPATTLHMWSGSITTIYSIWPSLAARRRMLDTVLSCSTDTSQADDARTGPRPSTPTRPIVMAAALVAESGGMAAADVGWSGSSR